MYGIDDRPSWHEWAMGIAEAVAARADCTRGRVGAVILDADHRVIGTGYPGVAPATRGCLEGACPRGTYTYEQVPGHIMGNHDFDTAGPNYCIATHSEVNAMLQAGSRLNGATIYVTTRPCTGCMKMIRNSGISTVVHRNPDNGRIVVDLA